MAWLHAKPRGHTMTRGEARPPPWPLPNNPAPDLTGMFWAAGPGMQTSAEALLPLTATELEAWARGTHRVLTPWEFQTMLDMSSDYCNTLAASKDPLCAMPWVSELTPQRRKDIAASTRALLRSK